MLSLENFIVFVVAFVGYILFEHFIIPFGHAVIEMIESDGASGNGS